MSILNSFIRQGFSLAKKTLPQTTITHDGQQSTGYMSTMENAEFPREDGGFLRMESFKFHTDNLQTSPQIHDIVSINGKSYKVAAISKNKSITVLTLAADAYIKKNGYRP